MTPELGYALTVGALVLALYGAGAAAMGALKGRPELQASSERAAIGVWLLITACMLLLVYAFLSFDFSVRYVANNTNRGTPVLLPHHRALGRARGLDHPLGVDALALHPDHGRPLPPHPAAALPVVARGDARHLRLLPPGDDGPGAALRAPLADSRRRPRAQSAAGRLRDDHAPGGALPRASPASRCRSPSRWPRSSWAAPATSGSPSPGAGRSSRGTSSRSAC